MARSCWRMQTRTSAGRLCCLENAGAITEETLDLLGLLSSNRPDRDAGCQEGRRDTGGEVMAVSADLADEMEVL